MRPRAPIYITKNVSELLFEGYDDELLDIARLQNDPRIPKVKFHIYKLTEKSLNSLFLYRFHLKSLDGLSTVIIHGNMMEIFQCSLVKMISINLEC
jgi:hypothetical protein